MVASSVSGLLKRMSFLLAGEDTVQGLVINERHLGRTFPVPLMVPPEVDPVSQLDLADVGVGALLQRLPQHSVRLRGDERLPSGRMPGEPSKDQLEGGEAIHVHVLFLQNFHIIYWDFNIILYVIL